jgi:proline iminopeptidase
MGSQGFETLTVEVPGGEIFATRRGRDEGPPVLLLHGGPGLGAEHLVGLVEELDGLIDGVLPQQRGLQPSTLTGPRDVETHVADAIAVLDHLGWERAWLIGHSWGGLLAMHIAVAHPDRVAGLVAIETFGAVPDGGRGALNSALVARLTPDERAVLDSLVARAKAGDDDPTLAWQFLTTLWPSYFHDHRVGPPAPTLRLEVPLADQPGTMDSVTRHFEAGTLERGLPDYRGPALFLHGDDDPLPSTASAESAALIPGARFQLIDDCGHFPWVERAGVVRDAVEAILRG